MSQGLLADCKHEHTIVDQEAGEQVCTDCGVTTQIVPPNAPKAPNEHSAIVSKGMIRPLGGVTDFQALNRAKVLKGALKDLFDGTDKKAFWIQLTEQLQEKGYNKRRIEEISAILRKGISKEKSDAWRAILEIVREALGVEV